MRPARLAAIIGLAALMPAAASAAPDRVAFSGCPEPGVENSCVIVKSGTQTYNVTAAKPPITFKGLGVAGTGVSGGMSSCMQGTPLSDIKYSYTRQQCPAPKPPSGK